VRLDLPPLALPMWQTGSDAGTPRFLCCHKTRRAGIVSGELPGAFTWASMRPVTPGRMRKKARCTLAN